MTREPKQFSRLCALRVSAVENSATDLLGRQNGLGIERHRLNSKGAKARRLKGQTLCVFAPLLFIPFHFSVSDFSVLLRENSAIRIPQSAFGMIPHSAIR